MASPSATSSTVYMILSPTSPCDFAASLATYYQDANGQVVVVEPQPASNPDVSGIGVSCLDTNRMMFPA